MGLADRAQAVVLAYETGLSAPTKPAAGTPNSHQVTPIITISRKKCLLMPSPGPRSPVRATYLIFLFCREECSRTDTNCVRRQVTAFPTA